MKVGLDQFPVPDKVVVPLRLAALERSLELLLLPPLLLRVPHQHVHDPCKHIGVVGGRIKLLKSIISSLYVSLTDISLVVP